MIGANTLDWVASLDSRESISPIFPGDINKEGLTSAGLPPPLPSVFKTSPLETAGFSDLTSEILSLESDVGLGNAGGGGGGWVDGICVGIGITGKAIRAGPLGGVEVDVVDEDWEFSFSESLVFTLSDKPVKRSKN